MATKAERFRAEEARSHQKPKNKKASSKKRVRKEAAPNESVRAGTKAAVALEDRAPHERPTRKSTRASSNRLKVDTNLGFRETRKTVGPEARARRAAASATRTRGSKR